MKLALIGYGKMGKEIEQIAISRGHSIELIIDIDNQNDLTIENLRRCEAAIEFTIPASAVNNFDTCFQAGIPVISGTTGWLKHKEEVFKRCSELNGTFFYASNFSIGVNLFFELNRVLAKLMSPYPQYQAELREVHHIHKLDSPSGTALSLADDLISILPELIGWSEDENPENNMLPVKSSREGEVPGIHSVKYDSKVDFIEISHSAKNRKGLALGAVLAAEFSLDKKGILTMKEMLKI